MFPDRASAGKLLAERLKRYANSGAVVLGIPRGGIVTASQVASELHLPLFVLVARKLGAPGNPELAIGAVANDGTAYWDDDAVVNLAVGEDYKKKVLAREFAEVKRRLGMFGSGAGLGVEGKTVLIVDDGIATGSTMKAAVMCLRKAKAKKIVVAVPVCPSRAQAEFRGLADEFVCLESPVGFQAVGQFYASFTQVGDWEVKRLLKKD